jgi:hypothetical protein
MGIGDIDLDLDLGGTRMGMGDIDLDLDLEGTRRGMKDMDLGGLVDLNRGPRTEEGGLPMSEPEMSVSSNISS